MIIKQPSSIVHILIKSENYFPGNPYFPLLVYRQVFDSATVSAEEIQTLLNQNNWGEAWIDGIYDHHHYHSNTHEVLVIIAGECDVQFGGNHGNVYSVGAGDVVILPAGVAHKSINMSRDFLCVGAYPEGMNFNEHGGHADEYLEAVKNIQETELPKKDPIFGEQGLLFNYWDPQGSSAQTSV